MTRSVPDAYFEQLYRDDPDPWRFASSSYEREKYAATLAAIGGGPVADAWEVGCSIGVFTRALASRCGRVLGVDVAPAALEQAKLRCAYLDNVTLARMRVPEEWPQGQFDLILFSEVLYYLSTEDIAETARRCKTTLRENGAVVLVHWTGETDYPQTGDGAVEKFCEFVSLDLEIIEFIRKPEYRLDVLRKL